MDIENLISQAKTVRENEREDLHQTLENHLTSSVVVMGHAELVREGRREDAELAAALAVATDPTSQPRQQDDE